ncbi:hypothetical protein EEB14_07770 [Rhodococcus sp. WS4]|nr:hypothetical protein EEB14_07770 [Rhodococcus sp. WS4]
MGLARGRFLPPAGYEYYRRKFDDGKTPRDAIRCLKHQGAKRLWRTMRDDHVGELTLAAETG